MVKDAMFLNIVRAKQCSEQQFHFCDFEQVRSIVPKSLDIYPDILRLPCEPRICTSFPFLI
jgi:hypothetical protein